MTRTLRFVAYGAPAPKGSVTRMPQGGYVQGRDAAERTRITSWATAVTEAAVAAAELADWQTLRGPVGVTITFYMPATKDVYRTRHITSPDIDKLARNTFDALKVAGVIGDDALVCDSKLTKRYTPDGRTGADITVYDLSIEEARDREHLKGEAAAARVRARHGATQEALI